MISLQVPSGPIEFISFYKLLPKLDIYDCGCGPGQTYVAFWMRRDSSIGRSSEDAFNSSAERYTLEIPRLYKGATEALTNNLLKNLDELGLSSISVVSSLPNLIDRNYELMRDGYNPDILVRLKPRLWLMAEKRHLRIFSSGADAMISPISKGVRLLRFDRPFELFGPRFGYNFKPLKF